MTCDDILVTKLPDLVIGKVFSYLHWTEKLWLVEAYPSLNHILHSPLAWEWFSNSDPPKYRSPCSHCLDLTSRSDFKCIEQFGRHFQHAVIHLRHLTLYDEPPFRCLELIANQCCNLQSLCIIHDDLSFRFPQKPRNETYLRSLETICQLASLRRLELLNVNYCALDVSRGVAEILEPLLHNQGHGVAERLVALDFVQANWMPLPISSLACYTGLQRLRVPIHSLNTHILQALVAGSLCELYLVSDDLTVKAGFSETSCISWTQVAKAVVAKPSGYLNVHYIFEGRALEVEDLCLNPLTHSVIIDSLSVSVSSLLLQQVADLYGPTLHTFAHFVSKWMNDSPYTNVDTLVETYSYFASKCEELWTFATSIEMVDSVFAALAAKAGKLVNLYCTAQEVCFPLDLSSPNKDPSVNRRQQLRQFEIIISKLLGHKWAPLSTQEMNKKIKELTNFHMFYRNSDSFRDVNGPFFIL